MKIFLNFSKKNYIPFFCAQTDDDSDDDLVLHQNQQESKFSQTNSTEYQMTDYNGTGYITNSVARPTTLQPIISKPNLTLNNNNNKSTNNLSDNNSTTTDNQRVLSLPLEFTNHLSSHVDSDNFI